jgi:hypothetical protein
VFDTPSLTRHASECWHPRLSLKVAVANHESKPTRFGISASFLEKKKQKTLFLRALAALSPRPAGAKVFWLLFFKKVTTSFRLYVCPAAKLLTFLT